MKPVTSAAPSMPVSHRWTNGWGGGKWGKGKRECPFYKRVPGTSFVVDAFSYGGVPGATGYFLTHFHSDHYGGLTSSFAHGTIYCSPVTRALVLLQLRVDETRIVALPIGEEVDIMDAGLAKGGTRTGRTIKVTLMEANHCPGSVLMLFKVPNTLPNSPPYIYLHTGDMRAHRSHLEIPVLRSLHRIDALFLDTTYCRPQYRFPPQDEVIGDAWRDARAKAAKVAESGPDDSAVSEESLPQKPTGLLGWLKITPRQQSASLVSKASRIQPLNAFTRLLSSTPRTLIAVGAYQIGKERLFKALAISLRTSIFSPDSHKRRVLRTLGDQELTRLIVDDPRRACVHVVGMGKVDKDGALEALEFANARGGSFGRVVAIRPTGWTWGGKGHQTAKVERSGQFSVRDLRPYLAHPKVTVVPLPYSEHSSFDELEMFVTGLSKHPGVRKVVPTVGSGQGWKEIQRLCDMFRTAGESSPPVANDAILPPVTELE
ncbi:DRMBL-domain-containing protein [Gonapodya prolifera JEL478]|uniref:DRMBL-domain-containing protein n=1 Tax=Gonapodya prolifera (strain JEL478) TaxID=1344416 RepID=A0A139A8J3_GONPJ|nr:DRMBL-domain-containing protein [Gonapodya prolifera JEL478]|eukprot:KXS13024.1 DRMBL-domain-containing protein [Gonapodya prolifera JEL478]